MARKKEDRQLYPLVNLTGIHLFPTLIVFAAMLPAFYTLTRTASNDVTILIWAAFLVCVTGTWLEFIADEQQRTFKRLHPDRSNFCRSGVWAWSRHPNYLGEVMFWWGIYFFVLASNPAYWWTAIGAVAMTLMFIYISIPMMEKRMIETRPLYMHYQKEVPAFFPAIKKMVSVVHQ
jgi:steroid 5-alpha reductase family enzyme